MTEQQIMIEKLMAFVKLPRWPTVYVYLFACVVVFLMMCMLVRYEFLQLSGPPGTFVNVMVMVITMWMVRVGGGAPRDTMPLLKFGGLTGWFFIGCSMPASLVAGILYGMLRFILVGDLPQGVE